MKSKFTFILTLFLLCGLIAAAEPELKPGSKKNSVRKKASSSKSNVRKTSGTKSKKSPTRIVKDSPDNAIKNTGDRIIKDSPELISPTPENSDIKASAESVPVKFPEIIIKNSLPPVKKSTSGKASKKGAASAPRSGESPYRTAKERTADLIPATASSSPKDQEPAASNISSNNIRPAEGLPSLTASAVSLPEPPVIKDVSPDISKKEAAKHLAKGRERDPDTLFRVSLRKEPTEEIVSYLNTYIKRKYKKQIFDSYLFVSIKKQRMYHIVNNEVVKTYVISGSKVGVGNKHGSNRTPLGLHSIIEKHGYNAPKGGLMVERNYTGKVLKIHKEKFCVGSDDVTTRVMWLKGEEPGVNQGRGIDSYQRFIYIHGTPEEGLIGIPSSEGCIRMKNSEVIDLFNYAYVGMKVLILDEL